LYHAIPTFNHTFDRTKIMAKKGNKRDGSKSAAVADFMAANPKLTAKQIHEGLIKQGVKVSLATV